MVLMTRVQFLAGAHTSLIFSAPRLTLWPIYPPIHWIAHALSKMVKYVESEVDQSPSSSEKCTELHIHSAVYPYDKGKR